MPMCLDIKLVRHTLVKSCTVSHLAVLTAAVLEKAFLPLFPPELSGWDLNSHLGCSLL